MKISYVRPDIEPLELRLGGEKDMMFIVDSSEAEDCLKDFCIYNHGSKWIYYVMSKDVLDVERLAIIINEKPFTFECQDNKRNKLSVAKKNNENNFKKSNNGVARKQKKRAAKIAREKRSVYRDIILPG